jgi:hypothetical protein
VKNFHLPLPDQTYLQLRAEAERTHVPATSLAREAIDFWLREKARKARHDAIAAYAAEVGGTALDLDPELEAAGIDHLLKTVRKPE